ncbi:adenylate/guanylate cyclase domain-containing protein [Desulfosarcina widdelii]|nr:adenylate/guanylate cyclase domain-containing protein [Desulfosarcina widdelii]
MPDDNGPTGHPMNEIARRFTAADQSGRSRPEPEPSDPPAPVSSNDDAAMQAHYPPTIPGALPPLSLMPDQIEAPAFFVDRDLSVRWMAANGKDRFSSALARTLAPSADDNIFNLLLQPEIKESLSDWQAFFSFVYTSLRRSTARETFDRQTDFIAREDRPGADGGRVLESHVHRFQVDSTLVGEKNRQRQSALRAFCLQFTEGTLFLLRGDPWSRSEPEDKTTDRPDVFIEPADRKETICVLSARLNDSHRIADTMLADVFFKMMNQVWEATDDAVADLGGVRVGCNGAQIRYLFKCHAGRNPIFSAISCATRMNERMRRLQEKIAARMGWAEELCMNMGICHGETDTQVSGTDDCMEFMIPGGALDQSSHLSALAGKGEIWITKHAVVQLPKKLVDRVVLGIDRQGEFLRNFFTRIADLPPRQVPDRTATEMGTLAVARILNIQTPAPLETKKD